MVRTTFRHYFLAGRWQSVFGLAHEPRWGNRILHPYNQICFVTNWRFRSHDVDFECLMHAHEPGISVNWHKVEFIAVPRWNELINAPGVHHGRNVLNVVLYLPFTPLLCWCNIRNWSSIVVSVQMQYGISLPLNFLQWPSWGFFWRLNTVSWDFLVMTGVWVKMVVRCSSCFLLVVIVAWMITALYHLSLLMPLIRTFILTLSVNWLVLRGYGSLLVPLELCHWWSVRLGESSCLAADARWERGAWWKWGLPGWRCRLVSCPWGPV